MIKILLFLKKKALKDLHPIKIEISFQQLKNNAREFPKNRRIRSNDRIIAATTFHLVQNTRSIHQSRQARVPNPPIDQTTVRRQVEICEKTPCFARAGLEEESTEAFPVHLIDAGCSTMREKKKRGRARSRHEIKSRSIRGHCPPTFHPFPLSPTFQVATISSWANLPGQTVNVRLPSMDGVHPWRRNPLFCGRGSPWPTPRDASDGRSITGRVDPRVISSWDRSRAD